MTLRAFLRQPRHFRACLVRKLDNAQYSSQLTSPRITAHSQRLRPRHHPNLTP
jgi:hypothetical protein